MSGGMNGFEQHRGYLVPLDRANVDTDQIIPKQFLKSIKRTGFGEFLFDAWRFHDEGELGKDIESREPRTEFVLNEPRYKDGSILLARKNFGCGSSREHAVWALQQYGFKCVIAPSFADIFFNNSLNNGFLALTLEDYEVDSLFQLARSEQPSEITVDLVTCSVRVPDGSTFSFTLDENLRTRLINGLDEIGLSLQYRDKIQAFEERHRDVAPWYFG